MIARVQLGGCLGVLRGSKGCCFVDIKVFWMVSILLLGGCLEFEDNCCDILGIARWLL